MTMKSDPVSTCYTHPTRRMSLGEASTPSRDFVPTLECRSNKRLQLKHQAFPFSAPFWMTCLRNSLIAYMHEDSFQTTTRHTQERIPR